MERKGAVTFKGAPLTLLGAEIKKGDAVPGFKVLGTDLSETEAQGFPGAIKLFASVPSLDTPVCDLEIKRFNEEAVKLSKEISLNFVSMDLPFALKRFCQAHSIKEVKTFSDHRDADFGLKFGVLIKELRLLSRAIFILRDGKVEYAQYVKELSDHPDYDAALRALKNMAG
jgi:thiol peroxidase